MAADMRVDAFIELLGHDGSEIINQLPDPLCRRGHHVQECVVAAMAIGYSATPFELFPQAASAVPGHPSRVVHYRDRNAKYNWSLFTNIVRSSRGVITGVGRNCHHAVAFDRGRILDPDGRAYPYSRSACEARGFYTQAVWRVTNFIASGFVGEGFGSFFAKAEEEYRAASEGQQSDVGSAEDGATT